MSGLAVLLQTMGNGTIFQAQDGGVAVAVNGHQVYVIKRTTPSGDEEQPAYRVGVYSDSALTQQMSQPLSTGSWVVPGSGQSTPSPGSIPGYIADPAVAGYDIDFYDATAGIRLPAYPLEPLDVFGTDGLIGGPGTPGLSPSGVASGLPSSVENGSRSQARWDLKLDFGAVGDGQIVIDGAITSGTNALACTTSTPFSAASVGKSILVIGAGASGGNLLTTISGYTDSGHVALAANAGTTVSGVSVAFGTDDTAAVNAAAAAMSTHGYAITRVPDGIYILAAAPSGSARAQVQFPHAISPQAYGFEGYQSPYGTAGYVEGTAQLDNDGAIFCSLQTSPGASPAVFAAQDSSGLMSNALIVMDGLTIRTPPSNAISGLNLYWAIGMSVGRCLGVRIDTIGPDGAASPPQAPPAYSYGLAAPNVGSRNKVVVGSLTIDGYTYGIAPSDGFVAQFVSISHCLQAVQLLAGYEGAHIEYLLTYACPRHIVSAVASNPCPLTIGHWAVEDDTYTSWVEVVAHLDTALTSGALLLGRVQELTHILSGAGRVTTALTKAAGSGSILFSVDRQYGPSTVNSLHPWTVPLSLTMWPTDAAVKIGTWLQAGSNSAFTFGYIANTSAAQNDAIGQSLALSAGSWTLSLAFLKNANLGIISVRLDGVEVGTIDCYAASAAWNQTTTVSFTVLADGQHTLSFVLASKNASSTGYGCSIYGGQLRRTA